jgi:hypothetical protein
MRQICHAAKMSAPAKSSCAQQQWQQQEKKGMQQQKTIEVCGQGSGSCSWGMLARHTNVQHEVTPVMSKHLQHKG